MEKRLVAISVVMTIGGLIWLTALSPGEPASEDRAEATDQASSESVEATRDAAQATAGRDATPEGADSSAGATGAALAVKGTAADLVRAPEALATLEAPGKLQVVLSTRGGALRSALLTKPQYHRRDDADVSSVPPAHKTAPGPLDLVSTWDAEYYPLQLDFSRIESEGLVAYDDGPTLTLRDAWRVDADFGLVSSGPDEVVFVWPDPARATSPLYVERRFTLGPDYQVEMVTTLHNVSRTPATIQLDLKIHAWQDPDASTGSMFSPAADVVSGACLTSSKLVYEPYHDLVTDPETPAGTVQWGGVATHYFLVAAAPRQEANTQCSLRAVAGGLITSTIHQTRFTVIDAAPQPCAPDWVPEGRAEGPRCGALYALLGAEPGASAKALAEAKGNAMAAATGDAARQREIEQAYETLTGGSRRTWTHTLFMGPKDINALDAAGEGFSEALDLGMLAFMAVPMLHFLRWAYSVTGLWVLAIIMLTVLVKLLLLPLTQKSFKQMSRMKQLAPEMEKLKQKYKDDRAKLNQEMMALYKARGANPLGGCLPMFLQMPVYFALYQTIYAAVELYQAPLFGWITNMTAPDPYFVLPVLLGGVMFVQQKLMPTTMDNAQAKMMATVMPVVFAGMMLFLPAGLVLYIFVNTLLGIGQQWYVYRQAA